MKQKHSNYAIKLARRRSAGMIHFTHPVDAQGQMTLNTMHMKSERSFARLRRSEEV